MLSREEFLKDSDLKREEVSVTGLGTVLMREMTVGEVSEAQGKLEALVEGLADGEAEIVKSLALVAVCICNPDGGPMFAEDELQEAVVVLKRKSRRAIQDLQAGFARLNGADEADVEAAVGNSNEITGDSGSSASPVISDSQASAA